MTQFVTTVTQFVPVQVPNKVIGQLKSHTVQGSSQHVKSIDCSNSPPGAAPNYWFGPELLNVTIFLNKPRLLLYCVVIIKKNDIAICFRIAQWDNSVLLVKSMFSPIK